jgi:hypothetical protein
LALNTSLGSDLIRHHLSRRSEWKLYHGQSAIWSRRQFPSYVVVSGEKSTICFGLCYRRWMWCLTEAGWFDTHTHILRLGFFFGTPHVLTRLFLSYHFVVFTVRYLLLSGIIITGARWKSLVSREMLFKMRWRIVGANIHLCKVSNYLSGVPLPKLTAKITYHACYCSFFLPCVQRPDSIFSFSTYCVWWFACKFHEYRDPAKD